MVDDLKFLLLATLQGGDKTALEAYLLNHSNLPSPRMNIALTDDFARLIGEIVTHPNPPVDRIEMLLDHWAALEAANNNPQEILPCTAVRSYGQVAVVRPDWWDDEIAKLHQAALHPRWRVRELVATALQDMLRADWQRTYQALLNWSHEDNALILRATVAAVAEPPLLTTQRRGDEALALQVKAIEWLTRQPPQSRKTEALQILRKALGFTLSVAIAATPSTGIAYLEQLSASTDKNISWIVRQNKNKHRLKQYLP